MVWTEITRGQYLREGLRYASDTTQAEWLLLSFFLPPPCRVGRPREVDLRVVMNAILYILMTGCQWRLLPKDFPPYSTVQYYFYLCGISASGRGSILRWCGVLGCRWAGTLFRLPGSSIARVSKPRNVADRADLTPASVSRDASDTWSPIQGFLLALLVHPANLQDNHGAFPLLASLRARYPNLRHIFADRVYRGDKLRNAIAPFGKWTIEIVTRLEKVGTFKPERKRWVIERTYAWLGRNRRLAKDYEATIASAEAWFLIASVRLLTRRLTRRLKTQC